MLTDDSGMTESSGMINGDGWPTSGLGKKTDKFLECIRECRRECSLRSAAVMFPEEMELEREGVIGSWAVGVQELAGLD